MAPNVGISCHGLCSREVVGPGRLELPTSRLSGVRSNHLSYGPSARSWVFGAPPGLAIRPSTWFRPQWERPADGEWKEKRRRRHPASMYMFCDAPIGRETWRNILRKEVIQPQVPLRLPCYDFTPVADPTVVACLLAVSTAPSGKANSHGVTGGGYKARERIHRGMLIRDY